MMQDTEQCVGVWIPHNIEDSIVPSTAFTTEARLLCVMVFQLERVMAALGLALTASPLRFLGDAVPVPLVR
ncbi:MAG: hypothetical protein M0022_01615, partial [Desulfobacteraceae bacterium]|nr:hypothetical protein [Desulfobacteraceae bacterium]